MSHLGKPSSPQQNDYTTKLLLDDLAQNIFYLRQGTLDLDLDSRGFCLRLLNRHSVSDLYVCVQLPLLVRNGASKIWWVVRGFNSPCSKERRFYRPVSVPRTYNPKWRIVRESSPHPFQEPSFSRRVAEASAGRSDFFLIPKPFQSPKSPFSLACLIEGIIKFQASMGISFLK